MISLGSCESTKYISKGSKVDWTRRTSFGAIETGLKQGLSTEVITDGGRDKVHAPTAGTVQYLGRDRHEMMPRLVSNMNRI